MDVETLLSLLDQRPDGPLVHLVQGHPVSEVIQGLKTSTPQSLLGRTVDATAGRAVIAGLHLAADGFEQAHEIAQDLPDDWGAWWHAILHRREPDPSNALYWYRRVRPPASLWNDLGRQAAAILEAHHVVELESLTKVIRDSGHWEPIPFVNAVERGQQGRLHPKAVNVLADIQRLEWKIWFDHCRAAAVG